MGFGDMHLRVFSLNYRHPSRAELELEVSLANARLGTPVRVQYPILGGFVDFALPHYLIAIEVDDKSHKAKADKDAERRAKLSALGWKVLVVSDADCLDDESMDAFMGIVHGLIDRRDMLETPYELRENFYKRKALERKAKKDKLLANGKTKKANAKDIPLHQAGKAQVGGGKKKAASRAKVA